MEDVLEVYTRPYDPRRPLVCLDETSKQLLRDTRAGQPPAPGRGSRVDYEYEREGVVNLFLCCEPLAGQRWVDVTAQRTRRDWAQQIQQLVDVRYPNAERIVLIMDNLNTHTPGALYDVFPPAEAKRLADKLEIHSTPKHGSWREYRRDRAQRAQPAMSGSPRARCRHARARSRRLAGAAQRRHLHRGLALHHRRRAH
jgi:hypothetical protein